MDSAVDTPEPSCLAVVVHAHHTESAALRERWALATTLFYVTCRRAHAALPKGIDANQDAAKA